MEYDVEALKKLQINAQDFGYDLSVLEKLSRSISVVRRSTSPWSGYVNHESKFSISELLLYGSLCLRHHSLVSCSPYVMDFYSESVRHRRRTILS